MVCGATPLFGAPMMTLNYENRLLVRLMRASLKPGLSTDFTALTKFREALKATRNTKIADGVYVCAVYLNVDEHDVWVSSHPWRLI